MVNLPGSTPVKSRPLANWSLSTPEDQGMDSLILERAYAYLRQNFPALFDLLIIRNGRSIFSRRNPSAEENTASQRMRRILRLWARLWGAPLVTYQDQIAGLWNIRSVAKSVTTLAVGIAKKQGIINSLDTPVLSFFPESMTAKLEPTKHTITLRHLLTMTSGLASIDTLRRNLWLMTQRNWTQALLNLPLQSKPGRKFVENSTDAYLLSAIITEITGQSLFNFTGKHLFTPLNIQQVLWEAGRDGVTYSPGNLLMTIEDQTKLGQLMLQDGKWEGNEVVPAEWMDAVLTPYQQYAPGWNYGYSWYLHDEILPSGKRCPSFSAAGSGGQKILVIPDLQLVLAANARTDFKNERSRHLNLAISQYIMSAFRE